MDVKKLSNSLISSEIIIFLRKFAFSKEETFTHQSNDIFGQFIKG